MSADPDRSESPGGEHDRFSLWWPLGIGVVVAVGLAVFYVSRGGEWAWPAIMLLVLTAVFPVARVSGGRRARVLGQDLRRRRGSDEDSPPTSRNA